MSFRLPKLAPSPSIEFPDVTHALREPNGLLTFGGDLSVNRLLSAYRSGIFPWYSDGEPILWWSPDPRMVIRPEDLHLSRRLRRSLRKSAWQVSADSDFAAIIDHCADVPRRGHHGTWITQAMRNAYIDLHTAGHAHSIAVRNAENQLVGGLYGVAIGQVFFGESMFSLQSGGSQVAIAALCDRLAEWGYALLDGQVESAHLARLGFASVSRAEFVAGCRSYCAVADVDGTWCERFGSVRAADLA